MGDELKPVAWIDAQELRYLEMVSGNKAWGGSMRKIVVGGNREGWDPLYPASSLTALMEENERLRKENDGLEAKHACEVADMALRFRAVNVERLSEQLGADVFDMRLRLDTAEARATAAEAEVERITKAYGEKCDQLLNAVLASTAAEDKLAEAMKVIEPFADVAEHDIGDDEFDDDVFRPISSKNARAQLINVGHLRAARAFYEKEKNNG